MANKFFKKKVHSKQDDQLFRELCRNIGSERVKRDGASQLLYSRDGSAFPGGIPGIVCFPETTQHVVDCIKAANRHDRSFVPRGAGTGLAGGAVPCDAPLVISTTKMNSILEVNYRKTIRLG